METNKTFYMVFVDGSSTPTFKHETLELATKEAQRLCEVTRNKAYVLCTLKSFEVKKYHVEDCRPFDDNTLPF